jgi:hypothetical protein
MKFDVLDQILFDYVAMSLKTSHQLRIWDFLSKSKLIFMIIIQVHMRDVANLDMNFGRLMDK